MNSTEQHMFYSVTLTTYLLLLLYSILPKDITAVISFSLPMYV